MVTKELLIFKVASNKDKSYITCDAMSWSRMV